MIIKYVEVSEGVVQPRYGHMDSMWVYGIYLHRFDVEGAEVRHGGEVHYFRCLRNGRSILTEKMDGILTLDTAIGYYMLVSSNPFT